MHYCYSSKDQILVRMYLQDPNTYGENQARLPTSTINHIEILVFGCNQA